MKLELDESLSRFLVAIVDAPSADEATRAIQAGFSSLEGMLGRAMEVGTFLCIASAIASALAKVHKHRLVQKDIKPANHLVNRHRGEGRLTWLCPPPPPPRA